MNPGKEEDADERQWVTVAKLVKARGNRGELAAIPFSTRAERYEELGRVFVFGEGSPQEVESVWFHGNRLILKFRGIDTISDAEALEGAEVRIPRAERPELEPGEFYHSDLVGCRVVERQTGNELGVVIDWHDSGGPGLLETDTGLLIPFARSICVIIEPAAGRIVVELPPGLKELNRP